MASLGQTPWQTRQPWHLSSMILALPFSIIIVFIGHTSIHALHPVQRFEFILGYFIFYLDFSFNLFNSSSAAITIGLFAGKND